ncbi:MAG: hypothetical protein VB912_06895 [Pirellulaceae bacterium]
MNFPWTGFLRKPQIQAEILEGRKHHPDPRILARMWKYGNIVLKDLPGLGPWNESSLE